MNNKPSTTTIKTRGQIITIGKDTLKTAEKKLGKGCFNILDTQYNKKYSFFITDGLNEEIFVKFDSEYVKNSKIASMNRPVFAIDWDYEHMDMSEGCNHG